MPKSRPRSTFPTPAPPRKRLGQHFLADAETLDRIVAASGVGPDDMVLEIGAGTGELTERLAAVAGRVVAVEIDETLARHVRARLAGRANVEVVRAGVLDHPLVDLLAEGEVTPPYSVVANIPYYITAPILREFLEKGPRPERMTLMVQKEVAESIVAGPGKLSLLAVSVQFYAEPRLLFTVPASAFHPPPKVASAVIQMEVRSEPAIAVADVDAFFEVVRAGFANPRKQIHNALAGRLWLPPDSAPELLRSAGIDPMRRAQTLSLEEWARLTEVVLAAREKASVEQRLSVAASGSADV